MLTNVMFLIMVLLFTINMPIAFAMGISGFVYLLLEGGIPLAVMTQRMSYAVNSFPMMAIPFFILAGLLMNRSGITESLVAFAKAIVGHVWGGLAQVAVGVNIILAGMSGSAIADAAATGSLLIDPMVREGYSKRFAATVIASAATIGPIIPPSIPFVIVGSIAELSIGKLFAGGIVPGLLLGVFLMVMIYFVARKRNYAKDAEFSFKGLLGATYKATAALLMPVIMLGGMFSGIFTATEAAVVAVVYAYLVGTFFYKTLTFSITLEILLESFMESSKVLFIVSMASIMGWIISSEQIGEKLITLIMSISENKWVILFLINIALFAIGAIMDMTATLLILTPILLPLMKTIGVDPIHFAVVFVLNLQIGSCTPPVGMVLYTVCSIAKLPIWEFAKEYWPFFLVSTAVVFLITYIPALVLFVPRVLLGF